MPPFLLSSSILSADFTRLGDQIHEAEQGGVDWIHCDILDGHFAPNISMGPVVVEACRRVTALPLDVHLMIENPDRYIEAFAAAGANVLSVHVEGNPHVYRTLQSIRALGCRPGIVLNPGTPAAAVSELLPLVDLVLVMSVNPGFSGQAFIPAVVGKIAEIRRMLNQIGSSAHVEVDGGITAETLPQVVAAGADVIVAATAIFKHPQGIAAGIAALRQAA